MDVQWRPWRPDALLRALADVLTPAGEVIIETYGSHLPGQTPAVEVHEPGEVYHRDGFVYGGFPAAGLRRLARIADLCRNHGRARHRRPSPATRHPPIRRTPGNIVSRQREV